MDGNQTYPGWFEYIPARSADTVVQHNILVKLELMVWPKEGTVNHMGIIAMKASAMMADTSPAAKPLVGGLPLSRSHKQTFSSRLQSKKRGSKEDM